MNGASLSSLPCPTCCSSISLTSVEWCHCQSKALSVICPSCRSCFCKLRVFPKRAEWTYVIRALLEKQSDEKAGRVLKAVPANAEERPTVLIVDDDEEIRVIAQDTIEQMGYHVITAGGAEEALAVIEQSRPDIVLTDALMPKTDGRELCRMIKDIDSSIVVVIMTALYKKTRYRIEAMNTFRADEYLAKPIDFTRLGAMLGQFTAKAAA